MLKLWLPFRHDSQQYTSSLLILLLTFDLVKDPLGLALKSIFAVSLSERFESHLDIVFVVFTSTLTVGVDYVSSVET